MILATTPAPTVLPPSLIANLTPSSIAIGVISSTVNVALSPGIHISTPSSNATEPVTSVVLKKNCGLYPSKNGVCLPPSSFVSTYTSPLNFVCGVIEPGLASTCPLSMSSLCTPLSSAPMLSPACASSNIFLNISTPVHTVSLGWSCSPTISTLSCTLSTPLSILPVATVPLPVILNTSSTGIRNGLSVSLSGDGISSSTAAINSSILSAHSPSGSSNAFSADPTIIFVLSPSNSYSFSKSLISISTNSINSSSSTMSALFKNTTMFGTPTCLDNRMCSLVCGIGPSAADTTSIAPSICAAPVIMFFT